MKLALVSCIEGWRYWDGEVLRLLSQAPPEVITGDQINGERKTTEN